MKDEKTNDESRKSLFEILEGLGDEEFILTIPIGKEDEHEREESIRT